MVLVLMCVPTYDPASSYHFDLSLVRFLPALRQDHILVVKVQSVNVKDKTV